MTVTTMNTAEQHPDFRDKVREVLAILPTSIAPRLANLFAYRDVYHYRTGDGIDWPLAGLASVADAGETLLAAQHSWDEVFRPHIGPLAHRRLRRMVENALDIYECYAGPRDAAECRFNAYDALGELERLLCRFSAYDAVEHTNELKRGIGELVYGQPATGPLPAVDPADNFTLLKDAQAFQITEGLSLEIVAKRRIGLERSGTRPQPDTIADGGAGGRMSAAPPLPRPDLPAAGRAIRPPGAPGVNAGPPLPPPAGADAVGAEALRLCAAATRSGITAAEWGNLEQAVGHFKHAYELNPSEPTTRRNLVIAYNQRGNDYARNGQDELAIADYDAAIALDPEYAESYNNRGVTHTHLGQRELAFADYTTAMTLAPYGTAAYLNRGNHYVRSGEPETAVADYTMAIELDGYDAAAYNSRGNAHIHSEQYDAAIEDFNITLAFYPDHAIAHTDRGNAYALKGDNAGAIADYTAAIAAQDDYPVSFLNRGYAYVVEGEYEKAVADFDRAITLYPDCRPAYDGVDQAARLRDEIAEYDRMVAERPTDAVAWLARGRYLLARENYARAIADFTAALERSADDVEAAVIYNDRGLAYAMRGDAEQALADYDCAIARSAGLAEAWYNRALACRRQGDAAAAVAAFDRAIDLRPDYMLAHYNRSIGNPAPEDD